MHEGSSVCNHNDHHYHHHDGHHDGHHDHDHDHHGHNDRHHDHDHDEPPESKCHLPGRFWWHFPLTGTRAGSHKRSDGGGRINSDGVRSYAIYSIDGVD